MRRIPVQGGLRRAFTLVEVLISLVVSAVVLLAVYSFFLVQSRSYELQQMSSELDANLRFSQDVIAKALLSAGGMANVSSANNCYYAGSLGYDFWGSTDVDVTANEALWCVRNYDDASETRPDQLTVVMPDGATLFRGEVAQASGDSAACNSTVTLSVNQTTDPDGWTAISDLDAANYRYVLCSDYGRPGTPASYIFGANTGGPTFTSGTTYTMTIAPFGSAPTDYTNECDTRSTDTTTTAKYSRYLECAGAQIYTFYIANNSATPSQIASFYPANRVLYLSQNLEFYLRNNGEAGGNESYVTESGANLTGSGTALGDIPIAPAIMDLQVAGCARTTPGSGTEGCPTNQWDLEQAAADTTSNVAYQSYQVGLLARSTKTFPGTQSRTAPQLSDGVLFNAAANETSRPRIPADSEYLYRAIYFQVAPIARLDVL